MFFCRTAGSCKLWHATHQAFNVQGHSTSPCVYTLVYGWYTIIATCCILSPKRECKVEPTFDLAIYCFASDPSNMVASLEATFDSKLFRLSILILEYAWHLQDLQHWDLLDISQHVMFQFRCKKQAILQTTRQNPMDWWGIPMEQRNWWGIPWKVYPFIAWSCWIPLSWHPLRPSYDLPRRERCGLAASTHSIPGMLVVWNDLVNLWLRM